MTAIVLDVVPAAMNPPTSWKRSHDQCPCYAGCRECDGEGIPLTCQECDGNIEEAFQFRDWQSVENIQNCPHCEDGKPIIEWKVPTGRAPCPSGCSTCTKVERVSIEAVPIVRYAAEADRSKPYIVELSSPTMGGESHCIVYPDTEPGQAPLIVLPAPYPEPGSYVIVGTPIKEQQP